MKRIIRLNYRVSVLKIRLGMLEKFKLKTLNISTKIASTPSNNIVKLYGNLK